MPGQAWRKGYENMKQISTGAGLLGLGVCMLGTAFIATHRGSGEAFAQVTGGERRIVSTGVYGTNPLMAYRVWSDNGIDVRPLSWLENSSFGTGVLTRLRTVYEDTNFTIARWTTVDNGTSGFRPLTDVDMSGEVDGGDISQVLLDMNTRSDELPPPPIDCTINAPR
jgi:hypothetical protein